jgi:hypothetical protein
LDVYDALIPTYQQSTITQDGKSIASQVREVRMASNCTGFPCAVTIISPSHFSGQIRIVMQSFSLPSINHTQRLN